MNDVSFGFDLDLPTLDQISLEDNQKSSITEQAIDNPSDPSISSLNDSTEKLHQRHPSQRMTTRVPQFYSGSDIRHHQQQQQQHRTYPTQQTLPHSYLDLVLQYNQQRLANYSQQITYMNLVRAPYYPTQPPYVYVPTTYSATAPATTNDAESTEENNQTPAEQVQLVYATPTGQIYYQPTMVKKSTADSEQMVASVPTVYPTAYPSQYFYPPQVQQIIPPANAYFQPISSTSSVVERKEGDHDDDYENSANSDHRKRQQSSADIMSNALQLVYSQQRRNAQTDRFNLDDLSAYLAMKWTDAVDHYMQG